MLGRAAGPAGMIGGQILDMQSEKSKISLDELKQLHRFKTGKLIHAALSMIPVFYNYQNLIAVLGNYAEYVGLAYQVVDDILDVTATTEELGKSGTDEKNEKSTFVKLIGLEDSRSFAEELITKSKDILTEVSAQATAHTTTDKQSVSAENIQTYMNEVKTTIYGTDPVCGMTVTHTKHTHLEGNDTLYFCGPGCRERYLNEPGQHNVVGIDPVCKMKVKAKTHFHKYNNLSYYFCSTSCKTKFADNPEGYLNKNITPKVEPPLTPSKNAGKVFYVCPMHPEVKEEQMGDCPICGMPLEPQFEALGIGEMAEKLKESDQESASEINNRSSNMWTLIGLGTGIAYFYSTIALVLHSFILPDGSALKGELALYFESAAVIILLVLLGQVLEMKARNKTVDAVHALLNLFPKYALRIEGNEVKEISFEEIAAGDLIKVLPGEKIPVDGVVTEGTTAIDESMLTGEPIPVAKQPGDKVIGGAINGNAPLVIESTKVGTDTFLAKVIQSVVDAKKTQPQIQRYADKVATYFVPGIIGIAILAFIAWMTIPAEPSFSSALLALISVLIIACPCAIGLATPMSIMVSAGVGARNGLVIKDFSALETFAKVDKLIVDKTGTLTIGKPQVTKIFFFNGEQLTSADELSQGECIYLASMLESNSSHPLANAIVEKATEFTQAGKIESFENILGKGIKSKVKDTLANKESLLALGNDKLMKDLGVADELLQKSEIINLAQMGNTILYLYFGKGLYGVIAVADQIRTESKATVSNLAERGVEVIMATGDKEATAHHVAQELGIKEFVAEVMPNDKEKLVQDLQSENHLVGMAGDGINDSPALARANVGIAMGTGSDAAIETADITLVKSDLKGILKLRRLSELTISNIKQNLFFAFIYNFVGVGIAAGLLYPWFGITLSPMIASLAMSFSSVSVIVNALRLRVSKI
ncbi:hypothetical protein KUTeg_011355 [Tegillarca granosa]|uniref:TRASH domain-containing protein n=1 Tax=Tegillarca granosa TaxID=220873 RepID=A0ABQ9F115_TEGGR|nr:hypothetical protein KUTeg_011355 [Tegillarca granosa]